MIFKNTFTQVIRVFIRNLLLVSIVGVTSQYMYAANNYDAKQIECLTRNTYEEANKLTLFQTHNNLRSY